MSTENERLLMQACTATLLFHSGQPWTQNNATQWFLLTGSQEATAKVLCDFVRSVLDKISQHRPDTRSGTALRSEARTSGANPEAGTDSK